MPLGADISAKLLNGMVPLGGYMIQRMGRLIETGTERTWIISHSQ